MRNDVRYPKISVVTPSYNQVQYIEETITSVTGQDYPNLEYIVIDGGSTDGSVDIIKEYDSQIDYWVSENDRGQSHAINKGLKKTTGELIGWLNSDDYLLPGALRKLATAYLENEKQEGAYLGRGHKVDEQKEVLVSPDPKKVDFDSLIRWTDGNNFMQPACYWTREVMDDIGYLNERYEICMDLEYWIRISLDYPFFKFDADMAHCYTHNEAKTTKSRSLMNAETLFMISKFENTREAVLPKLTAYIEKARKLDGLKNGKPGKVLRFLGLLRL